MFIYEYKNKYPELNKNKYIILKKILTNLLKIIKNIEKDYPFLSRRKKHIKRRNNIYRDFRFDDRYGNIYFNLFDEYILLYDKFGIQHYTRIKFYRSKSNKYKYKIINTPDDHSLNSRTFLLLNILCKFNCKYKDNSILDKAQLNELEILKDCTIFSFKYKNNLYIFDLFDDFITHNEIVEHILILHTLENLVHSFILNYIITASYYDVKKIIINNNYIHCRLLCL